MLLRTSFVSGLILGATLSGAASAERAPALLLHLTDASYSGCATIDPTTMDCGDIVVEGDSSATQFAFVLSSHIGEISGVQFGVAHDPSVTVSDWTLCTGGLQIPEEAWPDSG